MPLKHLEIDHGEILSFLNDNGVKIPNTVYSVQIAQKQRIENIIGKSEISDLIILLISYGLIKLSNNPGNEFEKEKEIKILEIDSKKVQEKLLDLGAQKIFEGRIIDTYFDTKDKELKKGVFNGGDKSSIRIRYKTPKGKESGTYYCTIKRRDKKSSETILRDCYEEEFEIFNPIVFYELFLKIGLKKYKLKVKNRVGYVLAGDIKFDIDDYENIPELLEIEAKNSEIAQEYIKKLGLENKQMLNGGSSSLFKYYGLEMRKFF